MNTSTTAFTRRRWWRADPWFWGARRGYERLADWNYIGAGWCFFGPTRWDR
jgi:hypothetical protein